MEHKQMRIIHCGCHINMLDQIQASPWLMIFKGKTSTKQKDKKPHGTNAKSKQPGSITLRPNKKLKSGNDILSLTYRLFWSISFRKSISFTLWTGIQLALVFLRYSVFLFVAYHFLYIIAFVGKWMNEIQKNKHHFHS